MLYDPSINVGMLTRGPGIPAGSSEMGPVTTLDVGATFCDFAGTLLPIEAQSVSLRDCFEGKGYPHEAVYSE